MTQAAASGTYADSTRDGLVASASRIDFADAAAAVLTTAVLTTAVLTTAGHENTTYELGGDHAWDGPELAAAMAEVLGTPVAYSALTRSSTRLPSPLPAWTPTRSVSWWPWMPTSTTACSGRPQVTSPA